MTKPLIAVAFFFMLVFISSCGINGEMIRVRKGETLAKIAKQHHITPEEILVINQLADPSEIVPDLELFIPARPEAPYGIERPKTRKGKNGKPITMNDTERYANLPSSGEFAWPLKGKVTSGFGMRWGARHLGIDLSVPEGTAVHAAQDGYVIYNDDGIRGYGNLVILKHKGGFSTVYAHLSASLVNVGAFVHKGQLLAHSGNTGNSTGPHLHFEIRKNGTALDPMGFLNHSKPE